MLDGDGLVTNPGEKLDGPHGRTGRLIEKAMTEAGMSPTQTAAALNLKYESFRSILRGESIPLARTIAAMMVLFRKSPTDLVDWDEVFVRGEATRLSQARSKAADEAKKRAKRKRPTPKKP